MVHMVQNKNNIEFEIVLVLIKNRAYLREIARTINESHSTVLRKINELVRENILDYKKEGRNKTFFIKDNLKAKNYIYSAEIYKLSKFLKKHPEMSIIFEDIIPFYMIKAKYRNYNVYRVITYSSFVFSVRYYFSFGK